MVTCKYCKDEINKGSFCNRKCYFSYSKENNIGFFNSKTQRKNGILGGKIAAENNRKTNKSMCFDKKLQSKGGKTSFERKAGMFGFSKEQIIEVNKKVNATNKKNKTAFYDANLQTNLAKRAVKVNRKNNTGFFDIRIQRMGGQVAVNASRKKSKHVWLGVNFMSKAEMNIAKEILAKPILDINCSFSVGSATIDFFPQSYDKMYQNKFVEFHCFGKDNREIEFVYHSNLTREEYYNNRRKILDDNGYKNKELVVIS